MCMQISDFNSSTLSLVTLSKPKPYDNATLVDAKAQKQSSSLGRVILTFSSGAVRSKTLSHFIWGNGSPPDRARVGQDGHAASWRQDAGSNCSLALRKTQPKGNAFSKPDCCSTSPEGAIPEGACRRHVAERGSSP